LKNTKNESVTKVIENKLPVHRTCKFCVMLSADRKRRDIIMAYTCKNCGAVADAPGHLCNPCSDKENCSFCGAPKVDPIHMCKDKLAAMQYVCEGCGRVAMEDKHLCKPSPIG
jgi:hypothetical protein